MPKGVISRLNREGGCGFIKTERGEEILFERSQLQGMHFNSRLEAQQVEFEVARGLDNRPRAIKIRVAKSRS